MIELPFVLCFLGDNILSFLKLWLKKTILFSLENFIGLGKLTGFIKTLLSVLVWRWSSYVWLNELYEHKPVFYLYALVFSQCCTQGWQFTWMACNHHGTTRFTLFWWYLFLRYHFPFGLSVQTTQGNYFKQFSQVFFNTTIDYFFWNTKSFYSVCDEFVPFFELINHC